MKKLNIAGWVLVFFTLFCACSDDEKGVTASPVSQLVAEAREGAVRLKWNIPADSNLLYVRIQYLNPRWSGVITKNVSVYSDTILIGDLLARDGEYQFEVTTVGKGNKVYPERLTVTCKALPVKPVETKYSEKINLDVENFSSNCADPKEGEFANLIDGKLDNFFHSNWHTPGPFPQWIEIRLPEPVDGFEFKTWNTAGRDKQGPEELKILGSIDGQNWEELCFLGTELPSGGGEKYESEVIVCSQPYTYLRYSVVKSFGNPWFNLAELELYKVWYDIYDPENEKDVID